MTTAIMLVVVSGLVLFGAWLLRQRYLIRSSVGEALDNARSRGVVAEDMGNGITYYRSSNATAEDASADPQS